MSWSNSVKSVCCRRSLELCLLPQGAPLPSCRSCPIGFCPWVHPNWRKAWGPDWAKVAPPGPRLPARPRPLPAQSRL